VTVIPLRGALDAADLRVAVVRSRFNPVVTEGLLAGALAVIEQSGAAAPTVVEVEGAFELAVVARELTNRHDAVVCVGAVILGETDHYEHIAHRASEGLQRVMLDTGVPVAFGVLTVRDVEHALARSAPGEANKGAEAATAAIRTASLLRTLRDEGAG